MSWAIKFVEQFVNQTCEVLIEDAKADKWKVREILHSQSDKRLSIADC